MIFEWVTLNAAMEKIWVVAASRFTAKIEDFVVVFVILVQKASNLVSWISINVFETHCRKPVNNYTV